MNSSAFLLSFSAIHPAVYLLKHLLIDAVSDTHTAKLLALHLLKYIQRLSYVSVRALEPLLTLSSGKV